jgi:diadenylate cyclase
MSIIDFANVNVLIDFIVTVIVLITVTSGLLVLMKRTFVVVSLSLTAVLVILCKILCLDNAAIGLEITYFGMAIIYSMVNLQEFRYIVLNNVHIRRRGNKDNQMSKEAFYKLIADTVGSLSRTKTGAIITFEKSNPLDEIIKNGTAINAPVSQELLMTIFYPGTRLHDGAVVIKGNLIVAASVYYTPTTRALYGKYGSRHRAAFGISEITDSVTVVVSEETGRISIAYKANMESVSYDRFLDEFTEAMED